MDVAIEDGLAAPDKAPAPWLGVSIGGVITAARSVYTGLQAHDLAFALGTGFGAAIFVWLVLYFGFVRRRRPDLGGRYFGVLAAVGMASAGLGWTLPLLLRS